MPKSHRLPYVKPCVDTRDCEPSLLSKALRLEFVAIVAKAVAEQWWPLNTPPPGPSVMNITPEVAYLATFPTLALTEPHPTSRYHSASTQDPSSQDSFPWDESSLNPKNRIDSLVPVENPTWRIDGCTRIATQFYTIPLFNNEPIAPLRIDTFIPPIAQWSPEVVEVLSGNNAFLYCDARILNLGIAQHVLRILECWTRSVPDFRSFYVNLPFGSRIVLKSIVKDVRSVQVQVVRMHNLERELLSVPTLRSIWNDVPLPPTLDITQLELLQQFHDSISLVNVTGVQDASEKMIFKGLAVSPKYLYHELRILLTMPPHLNIMPPPKYLVTKRCRFGGKTGVVGFITTYHQQGTLRDILPFRRTRNTLVLSEQVRWAHQLTAALIHMQGQGMSSSGRFHSDLRLDNILLTSTDDILLIDFEHRGILAHSAAPEISALEYIDLITNQHANSTSLTESMREKYAQLSKQYLKPHLESQTRVQGHEIYTGEEIGYYAPWLCLNDREREAAEVYMLGRVLWCIFEGVSAPQSLLSVEYVYEPDLEFPTFRRTPLELRALVLECTRGWRPWLGGLIRRGKRLEFFGTDSGDSVGADHNIMQRLLASREDELKRGEEFLREWAESKRRESEGGDGNFFRRPRLKDVERVLFYFQNRGQVAH